MCLLSSPEVPGIARTAHFETTLERRPEGRGSSPDGKLREADSLLPVSSPFPTRPGGHLLGLRTWCHEVHSGKQGTDKRADGFWGVLGTVPTVLPDPLWSVLGVLDPSGVEEACPGGAQVQSAEGASN